MENQLVILPSEVMELAVKVSVQKQAEVNQVLTQVFTGTGEWERQVDAIEVNSIADKMGIQMAGIARKNVKSARISAEKIFDAKRDQVQQLKAEYDVEDKLWLKAKQVMQIKFKAIEEKAEWKAKFIERYEAEQKELRSQLRAEKVMKFNPSINRFEFEHMSDETFSNFLAGIEKSYNDKIEAERKAEEERIAKAKAEAEERERIRHENERLRAKTIEKETQLAKERAKAEYERKAAEALASKEREEAERKIKAEREAARLAAEKAAKERAKLEAELREKAEAEAKAKREAEQKAAAELKAKQEADRKAANAPDKEKLMELAKTIRAIELPNLTGQDAKLILVDAKGLIEKLSTFIISKAAGL